MFSVKGKLFPAFFMKKSTISPGIARLRDCEIARLRECEVARVRDCEIARLRSCLCVISAIVGCLVKE